MDNHCNICDPKCKFNNCICNESFKQFYDIYNYISNVTSSGDINIIKKWSISTMTICCSFNCNINIHEYIKVYDTENKMRFYNCVNTYISTKYQSKNKVSIKIFTNGNIQLAGILNVTSATYTIRKIFKRLQNINAFSTEGTPYISNVRICMINSDFKIDKSIKQSQLCKIIDENNYSFIKRYSFIPSKYPGINIKIVENEEASKCITCSVFRPGSVIITGGNDLNIYKQTLENLLFILKNNNVLY